MSDSDEDSPMARVKPERTTSTGKTRRRAVDSDSDDADSTPRPANGDEDHTDSHTAKRVKLENGVNGKGKERARVQDSDDSEDEDGEDVKMVLRERKQLVRDDTGYVTGSIVRIACHSFLTYDEVEFNPGPALNMIIGPNGTGKSTIACAIALGLGFSPKVLGRATKLSQYCKNDSNEETWIEIELKGHPGKKNLVIRRYLYRDSERTKFMVDGDETPAKEVAEKMEELQVQVGNLCTFLPQDRVASFAMMTASGLLRETERAAGHEQLSTWHDVLIQEYKTCKVAQEEVDRVSESLKRKQTKQAETEKEVHAFQQRERLEQELGEAQVLQRAFEYDVAYENYQRARQEKTVVANEIAELEERNRPFKDSKAALKKLVDSSISQQDKLAKKVQLALKDAESKKQQLAKADDERSATADKIRQIKSDETTRRENIQKCRKEIAKYEPMVENEPAEADTSEIDRQIRDKTNEKNDVAAKIQETAQEIGNVQYQGQRLKAQEDQMRHDLARLQEAGKVREAACQRFDQDAWRAVDWLRQNQDKFKGKIYEPARLNLFLKKDFNGRKLDVRDQSLVSMIEGPISMNAFSTFLFEKREDYDLMHNILVDAPNSRQPGSGLRINGAEITGNVPFDRIPRPLSDEELHALGFDAWAIDLLDGPEPVLTWLCTQHNLHRIPVQLDRRRIDIQAVEQGKDIPRYYTREGSNSIKYSTYGARFAQNDQRAAQPAKILNTSVDESRISGVTKRIEETHEERKRLHGELQRLGRVGNDLRAQADQLTVERDELVQERNAMSKARTAWQRAKSKLASLQSSLQRELSKPSATEKREQLAARMRKLMEKRVKLTIEYEDLLVKAADVQESSIKVHLQTLQAESDHRAMDLMVRERDEELEEKREALERATAAVAALLKEGKRHNAAYQEAVAALSDEQKERVKERRESGEETLQTIEDKIVEIESNLNCTIAVSPLVLDAYNKRKIEINDLKSKLEDAEEKLDESKKVIETTEGRWLPELEHLVGEVSAKFTASFETLGLLGEVRLAKDPDYEKWGIEIMVSFRDCKDNSADVELHVLSGHRQSGGERALTTVTYLLALAELARAPFALVDEINQGMDQRAERNMHKMLVETTCKADVGQYFLLTPKLLPDLVYHPKMKVLVINVSPWIPETLSLQGILDAKRKLNKRKGLPNGRAIAAH
ncbi:hypothetical protein RTG_00828 [Rhodotorula toruloides ATCC 204091]|uniref:Structural maintenance of chromosomes protein 5 n=1 Tax=Rhodotorula toruloides TaxID=5286 RepID=A0A0K3CDW1_RHOTO|nr:hypothetical protein RTG_00828 [Rhodotorula toruloides ATCC 204091]KAK4333499.1 Structural maintenance of chromosomes protein 5 [Rhodotorula toruloides]PRQ74900.1 P-loop containing nucleoside triphosphate hydrolase protein [Rhodotorula toruloides]